MVEVADAPHISVVVASVQGEPALSECLRALAGQWAGIEVEFLVVERLGPGARDAARRELSGLPGRIVAADGRTPLPQLRRIGIDAARGEMVAVLADHHRALPGWLASVERARLEGRPVVGGSVEIRPPASVLDWASYLWEYAAFGPPFAEGAASAIPGNNVAYARSALARVSPRDLDRWEFFLHRRLRDLSIPFHADPGMRVAYANQSRLGSLLRQRYHLSRSFAAMRLEASVLPARLAYAAATLLLPFLLLARTVRTVWRKPGLRRRLLSTAPVLVALSFAGAFGEFRGALWGGGSSLERVT